MTDEMTLTVKIIDGEPFLDVTAMSILFGIDAELITAHSRRSTVNDRTPIPP